MADASLHRRALVRLRHRLDVPTRALTSAMRWRPTVTARFAGVLDGRTLNLDVPVPGVPVTAITGAELRVVRGRVRHTLAARVRPEPGGSSLSATVLLAEHPHGLGLTPGSPWLLEAVLHTADGTTSYAVLHGTEAGEPESPTLASPSDPATGRRYELRAAPSGRLGVTVGVPAPMAEVTSVAVDWLRARVEVRLVGCTDRVTRIELTARTGEGRLSAEAVSTPGGVRCDLPLRELALLGGAKETFFDVHVRTPARRLRAGRFLHDVADPKRVLVPPAGIVWAAPGLSVNLRPYYTPAGSLTLACRPIASLTADGQP